MVDGILIVASLVMDVIFLGGVSGEEGQKAVAVLIVLLLWRIARVTDGKTYDNNNNFMHRWLQFQQIFKSGEVSLRRQRSLDHHVLGKLIMLNHTSSTSIPIFV